MKVENLTIKLRVGYNLPIAIVLQGAGADIQPLTYLESELEEADKEMLQDYVIQQVTETKIRFQKSNCLSVAF